VWACYFLGARAGEEEGALIGRVRFYVEGAPGGELLNSDEVAITQTADGALVIRPIVQDRGARLLAVLEGFDDDFVRSLERDAEVMCPRDSESLIATEHLSGSIC